MDTHGPYKATKLWNDIIRTFRTSMPVGRHRKGMRVYENCFCAADAVDWLQVHLSKNPNFGSDVGRHQIVQLLGKFHKSGVFHDVRGDAKHNAEPFDDTSSRLFKFSLVETTLSPLTGYQQNQQPTAMDRASSRRSLRAHSQTPLLRKPSLGGGSGLACGTPMRPRQTPRRQTEPPPQPQHHHNSDAACQQIRVGEDLDYVWLDAALTRLRELLELRSADELTDARRLRADCVRANLSSPPPPLDPADNLPDWVANAVRCLARWPDTGMRSLPSYEGFELDIFAALCEFFEGRDAEPLVPCELRDLFVNVLVMADNLAGARAHSLMSDSPQQQETHRRRHRNQQQRSGQVAMTTSCAEIMRQIALPQPPPADLTAVGHPPTFTAGTAARLSTRKRRPRHQHRHHLRSSVGRGAHSDCEGDSGGGRSGGSNVGFEEASGASASAFTFAADVAAVPRWPPPLRRSAASEADGLGRDGGDYGNEEADGVHTIDSDSLLASGLQVAALFLPPSRRRRLHQLLRTMHRLGANDRLRLDPLLPTPHVVLHSLAACALRKPPDLQHAPPQQQQKQQQPDVFALQLVAFMSAHYSLIFRAPADLRECVEARLADMQALRESRPQVCCGSTSCVGSSSASGRPAAAPTVPQQPLPEPERRQFCSRIPAEQFSLAGRLNSDQALLDLLEGILGDENLPARDKKRKLRLFKESHPHVYSARFPDIEVERSVLNNLRGPQQQGFLGRTLTALRNWRL